MKKSKSWKLKLKKSKVRFPWKTGLFTLLLGTDLMAKQYIEDYVEPGEVREHFGGKLKIRKIYNRGLILDTLDHRPEIVKGVSAFAGGLLAVYNAWLMNRKGHLLKKFGMVFLSAGAASNIFDRLFRGKVVDYIGIQTKNKKLSKITANLADFYVFIGAVIAAVGR